MHETVHSPRLLVQASLQIITTHSKWAQWLSGSSFVVLGQVACAIDLAAPCSFRRTRSQMRELPFLFPAYGAVRVRFDLVAISCPFPIHRLVVDHQLLNLIAFAFIR